MFKQIAIVLMVLVFNSATADACWRPKMHYGCCYPHPCPCNQFPAKSVVQPKVDPCSQTGVERKASNFTEEFTDGAGNKAGCSGCKPLTKDDTEKMRHKLMLSMKGMPGSELMLDMVPADYILSQFGLKIHVEKYERPKPKPVPDSVSKAKSKKPTNK